jgi:hypothetical protein
LQDCQHVLELVLAHVDNTQSLARCSLVNQHIRETAHAFIKLRFHELLPVFLGCADTAHGPAQMHGPALHTEQGKQALQWFCNCAGKELMGSTQAAVTVLTCYWHEDRNIDGAVTILVESGEPPAALCGTAAAAETSKNTTCCCSKNANISAVLQPVTVVCCPWCCHVFTLMLRVLCLSGPGLGITDEVLM